ncbi:MAG: cupin domain-containing protein [bacterium]
MPFYKLSELEKKPAEVAEGSMQTVPGELMKAGVFTYPEGPGPPAHFHPNEEQFALVLEGKLHMALGDEDKILGPGDLIHVPRNTIHGMRVLEGPAVLFTAKSPAGDGSLTQDYCVADNADEIRERLSAAGG